MDANPSSTAKPRSKSLGRKLFSIFFILAALVVAAYFVVTSSAFIKGVILPRAGDTLNATITADSLSLSPFRHLTLTNLKVAPKDAEPVLSAKEIRLKYSLTQIIGGTIDVSEAALISPVIRIVQNADGTSNLDPILESLQSDKEKPEPSGATPNLNVRNVSIKDGQFILIQGQPGGGVPNESEISGLNLEIDQIKNGDTGVLQIDATVRMVQSEADRINGTLSGKFDWTLSDNLLPRSVQGQTALAISDATGTFEALRNLKMSLSSDLTPEEIKGLVLNFERGTTQLGNVKIAGPYNPDAVQADLSVDVQNIDRQVLDLVGAPLGVDFGNTVINSTNRIQVTEQGARFALTGRIEGRSVEVRAADQAAPPPLDIDAAYTVSVDSTAQKADIQEFNLQGSQNGRSIITATLSNPMQIAWGGTATELPASSFDLTVDRLNLADWKALLGDTVPAGQISAQLKLQAEEGGQNIQVDLSSQIQNLGLALGQETAERIGLKVEFKGRIRDMAAIQAEQFSVAADQDGQTFLTTTGSARFDAAKSDIAVKMDTSLDMPRTLKLLAMPETEATSGNLKATIDLSTDQAGQTNLVAAVNLTDFSGSYGEYKFTGYQAAVDSRLALKSGTLEIQKLVARLNNEGEIALSGTAGLEDGSVDLKIQSTNINERALRPFLESAMGQGRLVSVALDLNGSVARTPEGTSKLQTALAIKNLKVRDNAGKTPDKPLAAELNIDATLQPSLADLRTIRVALAATERASNQLTVSGKIPLGANATEAGSLTIQSDGLDLTPYYNLFTGNHGQSAPARTPQDTAPEVVPINEPETEPAPIELPFKQFALDVDIKKLFLREIVIEQWVTKANIDQNRVRLAPFKMTLNNAPLESTADIDLGVAGYRYDVMLKADSLPIAPIANSLSADYKDRAAGDLIVDTSLRGQGITGVNLKKHLNGHAQFAFTNANIQVVSPRLRFVITPIALLLRVQDILKSPINSLSADLTATNGIVQVAPIYLRSEAFEATVKGPVQIANQLMQTPLDLPIDIALRRSIAEKSNLLPKDTPPEAAYVSLPAFARLAGTLNEPEAKTDKLKIAGLIAQSAGGLPGVIGEEAAEKLQGIGNLLTGQGGVTNTNKTENTEGETETQKPAIPNPLDLINRFRKKD